ncbi:hypothetical protein J5N97_025927 [Dioscorea zingiberensis]|uniref:Uncharacterized protein n=1 Tax=Dioscorea zingiberensis TaxID=325984 RepID=A0A9D5H620_9LILI|nr:hypothetical protein J5N97_025927 [Dioscorea zingiberensis]
MLQTELVVELLQLIGNLVKVNRSLPPVMLHHRHSLSEEFHQTGNGQTKHKARVQLGVPARYSSFVSFPNGKKGLGYQRDLMKFLDLDESVGGGELPKLNNGET